jgi:hypothetical protein
VDEPPVCWLGGFWFASAVRLRRIAGVDLVLVAKRAPKGRRGEPSG